MKLKLLKLKIAVFLCYLCCSTASMAQLSIDIAGVSAQQFPVAVLSFSGDAAADEATQTLKNDLNNTGLFRILAQNNKLSETANPNAVELKRAGADTAVWGAVYRTADGKLDVRLRIMDTVRQTVLDSVTLTVRGGGKQAGHMAADRVYEKLTGHKGFFTSRLAYVTRLARDSFELRVADWDGSSPQTALRSKEPIISPTWSPDGSRLAYVSFENRKANIMMHDLISGARSVVANYKGSNSAPAFNPNGRGLAAALSRDGLAQIYSLTTDGAVATRLTQSAGIDTEPAYSPDGANIYFVSDRGGSPQIYRMAATGGEPKRVSFKGDYNISPSISPDGKAMAFISRREGKFMAMLMDLGNQEETTLSDTQKDESPSFSPNGKFVLYASEVKGRGVLILASSDGRIKNTLSAAQGDIREPAWSGVQTY